MFSPAWNLRALDPLASDRRFFWILAILSSLVLLAPIRTGDLAGYDDARYALVAKHVVQSGHWLEIESNGGPALEHPPLFSWMEAVLFVPFGLSDSLAKLPSALCGLGVILLVAWLGRRMTGDAFTGALAMFVMATSIYFIKYAARAMTDVPFTFFFLAAVCSWVLSDDDPRWLLAAGAFAGLAQLTRALMGVSIPMVFAVDMIVNRRRPPLKLLDRGAAADIRPANCLVRAMDLPIRDRVFRSPFDVHGPGSYWGAFARVAALHRRCRIHLDDFEILLAVAAGDDRGNGGGDPAARIRNCVYSSFGSPWCTAFARSRKAACCATCCPRTRPLRFWPRSDCWR